MEDDAADFDQSPRAGKAPSWMAKGGFSRQNSDRADDEDRDRIVVGAPRGDDSARDRDRADAFRSFGRDRGAPRDDRRGYREDRYGKEDRRDDRRTFDADRDRDRTDRDRGFERDRRPIERSGAFGERRDRDRDTFDRRDRYREGPSDRYDDRLPRRDFGERGPRDDVPPPSRRYDDVPLPRRVGGERDRERSDRDRDNRGDRDHHHVSSSSSSSSNIAPAKPIDAGLPSEWPRGSDSTGVLRVSRAALLSLYQPSLMPEVMEEGLKEHIATRDCLGPASWNGTPNWPDLWRR
jgi:hypothetical protein